MLANDEFGHFTCFVDHGLPSLLVDNLIIAKSFVFGKLWEEFNFDRFFGGKIEF